MSPETTPHIKGLSREERSKQIMTERPMSGFPVSIGTGLALETLLKPITPVYDEERKVPTLDSGVQYDYLLFNLNTILRNLLSHVKADELAGLSHKLVYETFVDEVRFLGEHISSQGGEARFYQSSYRSVDSLYKNNNILRVNSTPKQFNTEHVMKYCIKKMRSDPEFKNIEYTDSSPPRDKKSSVLIFTHIPYDLLSYGSYRTLDLLESNTGLVKTRKDWWSKYYPTPDEDMSFLPFMEYLLTVFGDRVMFKPSSISKRKDLLGQLRRKRVHPLMSEFSMEFMYSK